MSFILDALKKAEAERLMNEGVADAVTQSFFISRLGTDPIFEVNTLISALARSRPRLELRRNRQGKRVFLL